MHYGINRRITMISEKMNDLLNRQVQKEFYSAYLYLGFEAYFNTRILTDLQISFMYRFRKNEIMQ